MKTIFIVFITTLLLYACDKDIDGIKGVNPKLNIETYSFSKNGEEISIY